MRRAGSGSVGRRGTHLVSEAQIRQAVLVGLGRGITRSLDLARREIRASMLKQPTTVTASGRTVGLDPSRPGEPPKRVSGALARSLQQAVKVTATKVVGTLAEERRYAPFLEFGTRRMAARPHMRPVMTRNQKKFRNLMSQSVLEELRKLSR